VKMLKEVRVHEFFSHYAIHAVAVTAPLLLRSATLFLFLFLHTHARTYFLVCGSFDRCVGVVYAFPLALLDETYELTIVSFYCGDV
jgi:hypothetical protein